MGGHYHYSLLIFLYATNYQHPQRTVYSTKTGLHPENGSRWGAHTKFSRFRGGGGQLVMLYSTIIYYYSILGGAVVFLGRAKAPPLAPPPPPPPPPLNAALQEYIIEREGEYPTPVYRFSVVTQLPGDGHICDDPVATL